MTIFSNDHHLGLLIGVFRVVSYYAVASSVAVLYDWALTFGQEYELVWKQRWSLTSVLYFSLRYGGILYSVIDMPASTMSLPVTDAGCTFFAFKQFWASTIANTILGVIMIIRLHAMYQRLRIMLIFLVIIFLAMTIASGIITAIQSSHLTGEELFLSDAYHWCVYSGSDPLLVIVTWILGTVWEVLSLSFALWIAVKHFRGRPSTGSIIEDCFTVLIKSHIFYFASFAAVACFHIGMLSPKLPNAPFVETQVYYGLLQICALMQMFVLGPRLILSIREHHAQVMADSNEVTGVSTIVFEERSNVSGDGSV